MKEKQNQLFQAKLYGVLDAGVSEYDRLFDILDRCADGGVDVFQIRAKQGNARDVLNFTRRAVRRLNGRALFIVNDRVDLALSGGADGVHLGQEDLSVGDARRLAGDALVIGASCQTMEQAREAQAAGADYIGFGSVFKTATKPERGAMDLALLARVLKGISIPVFPIGGITCDNLIALTALGVRRVAVTRALCLAKDPQAEAKRFREILQAG